MSWEKQGSTPCNPARMAQFQHLLSECEFLDLEFKGSPYTWTNNQRSPQHLRERLDKALATIT
ncbi:hypothetical protein ACSBR2_033919 [Camellia fascicularis]